MAKWNKAIIHFIIQSLTVPNYMPCSSEDNLYFTHVLYFIVSHKYDSEICGK